MSLQVYSDSDWAGCRDTRKSRSGGMILLAGGVIKSWSNKQSSIAMSSGEAEYYALVEAGAEAIGVRSLARDLGWTVGITLHVDSSAAKAIASRIGIGKIRHLEVRYLWLQEEVGKKNMKVEKVKGTNNPADVLTKQLPFSEACRLLSLVHIWPVSPGD